ncbi:MAG: tail fiber protein [Sphingomonas sp.]|nr:tail fiber protein [Sphingomonas sp.]
MSQVYIGQIIQGGWNFAPRGFMLCAGQLLPIQQYSAVFALLGTAFGGNGQTTFGLPDLQGRTMVGTGQGPGLSPYVLGQKTGAESVTLNTNQMPAHTHALTLTSSLSASTARATMQQPASNGTAMLARSFDSATNGTSLPVIYGPTTQQNTFTLGGLNVAGTIAPAGGSAPVSILPPSLCVTIVIAMQGIFPSRN